MSDQRKTKLLLVGWDAADWTVLRPLLSSGKMPTLASLMSRGFHGRIASLQPMYSPLLWTSVATGFRAHDHGILNFVEVGPKDEIRAVRGGSRKKQTFWEILYEKGIHSNIIGWWPSHQAENTGGVQVSNFFQLSGDEKLEAMVDGCVAPEEKSSRYDELRVHVTEMTEEILAPFFIGDWDLKGDDPIVSAVAKIIANTASVHAAATEAMETESWDITAVYYDAIDHFKHLAMMYHPPKSDFISDEDFGKYRMIVEAGYRFHDMMLDRLLSLAGEEAHVLLLSDHGFTSGNERVKETPQIPGGPAAEHHPFGVLVGSGPQWKSQKVHGHSLLDICPAILHLFDAPVDERMSGTVPSYWWKSNRPIRFTSYADSKVKITEDSKSERRLLQDLETLGYIDLPKDNREAVRQVQGDSRYNEISSLLDGGHWHAAGERSAALCYDYPDEARYAYQNLGIQWIINPPEFESNLLEVTGRFPSLTGHYFLGAHAARQGFYNQALEHFEKLRDSAQLSPAWMSVAGKIMLKAGLEKACIDWLLPIHDQYERWAEPAFILAEAYNAIAEGEEEVSRALDYALEAVRRRYFYPEAHLLIARLAVKVGAREPADTAYQVYLQLVPDDESARIEHVRLLRSLGKNYEADLAESKTNQSPPVVIVSGWPRSGTSMMMRMLEFGGLEVYSDGVRNADSHNPNGYYESEEILRTATDKTWLKSASFKAAKVITPLLPHLPGNMRYLIIQMDRPLTDVIVSQEVMMGKDRREAERNFPFGKALQMQLEEEKIMRKMETWANTRVIKISYDECVHHPDRAASSLSRIIKSFMPEIDLNVERMTNVVDPKLNHHGS